MKARNHVNAALLRRGGGTRRHGPQSGKQRRAAEKSQARREACHG